VLLILQYAENCGFYCFHKEYLQILKDAGVIVFRPSNCADSVDEVVDLVECQTGSGEQRQALEDKQRKKALEEKMDNVIWSMNLIIGCCLCNIWMFTRDVCCKEVIMMLKVVLLLHLCG
jgi:hypothetical protein